MDGPTRTTTRLSSFHSLTVNDEATTSDHANLALIPSSSSRASSVTVNVQDAYAQLQPTVRTHGRKPETMQPTVLLALALRLRPPRRALLETLAQKAPPTVHSASSTQQPTFPHSRIYTCQPLPPSCTAWAWNWVDLDVKRMQPWLQLSRPEGATGRARCSLDYLMSLCGVCAV
ncbi:hypothetical protein CRV24_004625 [Beauveria bassiana]|nr:hypothetical protein CRV24_004625 [Beauveria bassiana]